MSPLDELALILRPAGGGLHLVSTGKAEQLRLQQQLYGVATAAQVTQAFTDALTRIATARVVLLGVPSDVGAGFRRGANLGPQALRTQLLEDQVDLAALGVVDAGDVFVVPQLLHDDMHSAAQLAASRRAVYPQVSDEVRTSLPVSPLSIAERAWQLILTLNRQRSRSRWAATIRRRCRRCERCTRCDRASAWCSSTRTPTCSRNAWG
jgi:hypothetical protein